MKLPNSIPHLLLTFSLIALMGNIPAKSQSSSTPIDSTILLPKSNTSLRPKVPTRQMITCTYDGDTLYFEFLIPEGTCGLYLYNPVNGETISTSFESEESPYVHVGFHSSAEITLTTEGGIEYYTEW